MLPANMNNPGIKAALSVAPSSPDGRNIEGGSDFTPITTRAAIEAVRTPRGGWTKRQLEAWGVPWPPTRGWKRKLIRLSEKSDTCLQFLPLTGTAGIRGAGHQAASGGLCALAHPATAGVEGSMPQEQKPIATKAQLSESAIP
jgi:hypothetical protein